MRLVQPMSSRIRQALAAAVLLGAALSVLGILTTGSVLAARNATQAADADLTEALRAAEARYGPDHENTLIAVYRLGAYYEERSRHAEAEPLYLRLLRALERRSGQDDPVTLAAANHLGRIYFSQRRHAEAEPIFRHVLESRERVLGREHPDTLVSAGNLAQLYYAQGRLAEAEPLDLRVLEGKERRLGREHPETLLAVGNLADLYRAQGRYVEAEPLYLRVLETRERLLGADHPDTLASTQQLASLYLYQRRYAEAEPLNLRVLETRQRRLGAEHPATLVSSHQLASLYLAQNRFSEAEPIFRRLLETRERLFGADHSDTIITVGNLATLLLDRGRHAEAESLARRALDTRLRLQGRVHPDTIDAAENLTRIRLSTSGWDLLALGPARLAASAIRSRRGATPDNAAGSAQREREHSRRGFVFLHLADAAWAAADASETEKTQLADEAFAALQDATAGAAGQAVTRMAVRRIADQTAPGLGALAREREALEDQWVVNSTEYSAALAGTDENAARLRETLPAERARIEARMDEIDAALRRDFPQYFALVRPEALDIAAARAMLAPDEAILLVVPTQFGTHVMGISRDGFEWARSSWSQAEINDAARTLLWSVGATLEVTPEQAEALDRRIAGGFPRAAAHALYLQTVAPVAAVLDGKRHVFVATSGALTSLPFGMLVAGEPQGRDDDPEALRSTRWFADAHALVRIPSVQSLQFLRRFARPDSGRDGSVGFVGFGDPALQGAAVVRGRGGSRSGGGMVDPRTIGRLSRLPGTATELESMRVALGAPAASLFLAERATETNFKQADLSGARILALATHGLVAGEVSGATEPGLVFTPPAEASEMDDGLLTASEVAALRLDADWVILSACNTAAGDGSAGAPALSGLARAFFHAGARALLVSHWLVDDDVASRLTVRTIQLLAEEPGFSRAEAFQRAMREIRNDTTRDDVDSWAHPFFWAPFTLIGDSAR